MILRHSQNIRPEPPKPNAPSALALKLAAALAANRASPKETDHGQG